MIIYEVRFSPNIKKLAKSAYFSSKSKADKFILSNFGEMLIDETQKHEIPKTKCQILKFLNRHNGLG